MLKRKAEAAATGLLLSELAIWTGTFFLAHWTRALPVFDEYGVIHGIFEYLPLLAVGLVAWAVYARATGQFGERRRVYAPGREVWQVVAGTAIGMGAMAAAVFTLKLETNSRLMIYMHGAFALGLLLANRAVIRGYQRRSHRLGKDVRTLAIVGDGAVPRQIAEAVRQHREWGLQFAGYITVLQRPAATTGPVLGQLDDIAKIVDNNVVDEVVFAVDNLNLERIEPALAACEEAGVDTRIVLDFFPHKFSKLELDEFGGFPMLAFHATSTEEFALLAKRAFDLVVSTLAILVGAPIFLGVAFAIKFTMPGPILFVQRRTGLNGREFDMYKFRSMIVDAEARRAQLTAQNEMAGPAFKMKDDPRVTPLGRFIRKTSLDEIPQFFNVFFGEMSIVGPRPPIPSEVAKYERWQRRRLSVKPGLTCIWQVKGRNNVDFDTWMKLDLEYIDNWSLWLDLKLFLMTIPAVLLARGAR
jgi:exopolysaccharide biosynthesis polyprenyl glycosylphosphotransferase